MYDPTLHIGSLRHELLESDFAANQNLTDSVYLDQILNRAAETARQGFLSLDINTSVIRGKNVYQLKNLSDELVLRRINRNLRRLTGTEQSNRDSIIRSIRAILTEGIDYRAYKIDVKNFYETISVDSILEKLKSDIGFPKESYRVLNTFFQQTVSAHINGLPRGIALSATLSEYVMRPFDLAVRKNPQVYFCSRFVDDVFVLTTGSENPVLFLRSLQSQLSDGLHLNYVKTRHVNFVNPPRSPATQNIAGKIEFLGYRFNIHERQRAKIDNRIYRVVETDIAPKKVQKIKTRIVLALRAFVKDNNYKNLHDRLKLLSGNYNIFDRNKHIRRNSGLYCNYRFVDFDQSQALKDLDGFLRAALLSRKRALSREVNSRLSKIQKRQLLGIGFRRSFENKTFYHFRTERLAELVRCWTYE